MSQQMTPPGKGVVRLNRVEVLPAKTPVSDGRDRPGASKRALGAATVVGGAVVFVLSHLLELSQLLSWPAEIYKAAVWVADALGRGSIWLGLAILATGLLVVRHRLATNRAVGGGKVVLGAGTLASACGLMLAVVATVPRSGSTVRPSHATTAVAGRDSGTGSGTGKQPGRGGRGNGHTGSTRGKGTRGSSVGASSGASDSTVGASPRLTASTSAPSVTNAPSSSRRAPSGSEKPAPTEAPPAASSEPPPTTSTPAPAPPSAESKPPSGGITNTNSQVAKSGNASSEGGNAESGNAENTNSSSINVKVGE